MGGELFGQVQLNDWCSVYGSMAYVDGTNYHPLAWVQSPSGNYFIRVGGPEGLPAIYPLHGKVSFRVVEPTKQRWGLEFVARLVAAQDYVAVSLAELPSPAFAVFDIHGYYMLRKNVRLTLSIDNLLNTYYSEPGSVAIIGPTARPSCRSRGSASASAWMRGFDGRWPKVDFFQRDDTSRPA